MADYLNNKFISTNVIKNLVERTNSLDCTTFARCMAFKAIGTTLFGDIFLNWKNLAQYEELLMTVAKDGFFWASYVIVPFWRRDYWRYRSVCERMKGLTLEILELSERNSNTVLKASCGDLLGLMLHGCVTTASLIENILTRLVLYPNLQEQVHILQSLSHTHTGACNSHAFLFLAIFKQLQFTFILTNSMLSMPIQLKVLELIRSLAHPNLFAT